MRSEGRAETMLKSILLPACDRERFQVTRDHNVVADVNQALEGKIEYMMFSRRNISDVDVRAL